MAGVHEPGGGAHGVLDASEDALVVLAVEVAIRFREADSADDIWVFQF